MKLNSIISKRTKLISLILIIFVLGVLVFYMFLHLVEVFSWKLFAGFLVYIILLEVITFLQKHTKLRIIQTIEKVFLFPVIVIKLLLDLSKPSIYIYASFFYIIIVAFLLPFSILKGVSEFLGWNLGLTTLVFIVFALGSILCVHQSKIIQTIVCSFPPLNRDEHKFQQLGRDLSKYILHPRNLSFILYFIYFVYLSLSGLMQLQYKSNLISEEIDEAISKAFLVYIAFTNMVTKSHEVDIQSAGLLKRMLHLIDAHDG